MQLSQLTDGLEEKSLIVDMVNKEEHVLTGIAYDSREIQEGFLFVAINGKHMNGEDYIEEAIAAGAVVVVAENLPSLPSFVTGIRVSNARKALATLANTWYQNPSDKIHLIGVTGTNGKTSVSWFLQQMLQHTGSTVGIIGTTGQFVNDFPIETKRNTPTTPESLELQGILYDMIQEGVDDVVMEVSSMALVSERTAGCRFSVGVFTNLTQDHLDDHGSMEAYKEAKLLLFPQCPTSIVNIDDPYAQEVLEKANHSYTYGTSAEADFRASDIEVHMNGVSFTIHHDSYSTRLHVPVSGLFTVYNTLAAISTCYALGIDWDQIMDSVSAVSGVRGRMETFQSKDGFSVIVDYAHSPDALEHVLQTVREFAVGRTLLVFGCGGDRDPSKREPMGKIAEQYAHYTWVTSDNPRTEEPFSILQQIE